MGADEASASAGTGLRSMWERADELDGTLTVTVLPEGGTEVRAVLPTGCRVVSVRVLVVDDHPFYREGIKTLLGTRPAQVEVVGEAATGEEGVDLCATTHPDVVLMDLQMPGIGGLAATRQITAAHPSVAVLVLTMHDDDTVLPACGPGPAGTC